MKSNSPQISFDYGKESDVLFIGLGSDEPSYTEEVDDLVLVERGMFTDHLTGFRLVGTHHHGIESVQVAAAIKKVLQKESREMEKRITRDKRLQGKLPTTITRQLLKQGI